MASKLGEKVERFKEKTGRKEIKVEIEPGTYLTANSGVLVSEIVDIKSTK